MDGTISTGGAQSARRLPTQIQLSGFSRGDAALQEGLFEQLLSMPPPAPVRPASASSPSPPADPPARPTSDANSSSAAESSADDSPRASADSAAEETNEDVDSTAAENQAALFAASVDTTSTTAVDEQETFHQPAEGLADDADDKPSDSQSETALDAESLTEQTAVEEATATAGQSTPADSSANIHRQLSAANAQPLSNQRTAGQDTPAGDQAAGDLTAGQTALDVDESGLNNSDQSENGRETAVVKEAAEAGNSAAEHESSQEEPSSRDRTSRREKWYERTDGSSTAVNSKEAVARPDSPQQSNASSDRPLLGDAANRAGLTTETLASASSSTASAMDAAALSALAGTTVTAMASAALTGAAVTTMNSLNSSLGSALGTTTAGDALREFSGGQGSLGNEGVTAAGTSTKASAVDGKTSDGVPQRTDNLTQAERVRVVQRIARSFTRLGPSGGQISIKLHPPQLGSLNVQVRMEGRTMTAKLSTETSAARDTILASLPVLRSRLAEQGFEIASFQVEVADNNADPTNSGDSQSRHAFGQNNSGDSGETAGRSVDYRRLALQQRQTGDAATHVATPMLPRELNWQMLAGMDAHA